MSKKKPTPGGRPKTMAGASLLRSSAAECLTFVAASGRGGVEAVYADENVWLSQKMMGLLYDVDVRTISYHLQKIFSDKELEEKSVIQYFRIAAADGKPYDTQHYNLSTMKELDDITGAIVDAALKIHMEPGPGLLESVYEAVLARALEKRGFRAAEGHSV